MFEGGLLSLISPIRAIPVSVVFMGATRRTRKAPMRDLVQRTREIILAVNHTMWMTRGIVGRKVEWLHTTAHEHSVVVREETFPENAFEICRDEFYRAARAKSLNATSTSMDAARKGAPGNSTSAPSRLKPRKSSVMKTGETIIVKLITLAVAPCNSP